MTTIKYKMFGDYGEAELTTEHAASSYGRPVLVIGGEAYGPSDLLPGHEPLPWLREPAGVAVLHEQRRAHEDGRYGCIWHGEVPSRDPEYAGVEEEGHWHHTPECEAISAMIGKFRAQAT